MLGFAKPISAHTPRAQRSQLVGKPNHQRRDIARALGHAGVQAKLQLGSQNDPLEQEADRIAEQVTQTPDTSLETASAPPMAAQPLTLHRFEKPASENDEPQPGEEFEQTGPELLPEPLTQRIARMRQQGRALPQEVRAYMEPRFGRDFSRVRIHTGEEAAQISEAIHARAFTLGEHIAFSRGAFQPHSHSGKKLVAHELTHVVQQSEGAGQVQPKVQRSLRGRVWGGIKRGAGAAAGAASSAVSSVAESVGDLVNSAGEFIVSKGWDLVDRFAPELKPILRQGPLEWLKEKIGSAFNGLVNTLNELNPGPALTELSDMFSELLSRAGTILQALMSGDCGPLFEALGQLKSFVTDVAGQAWDKLTDFLAPIGDFFSNLWDSTGARAMDWLGEFAGELWDGIKALGAQIWDWTQPIRDAFGAAWDWVKKKLFGSENSNNGNSEGGLVDWFKNKASEAWNWVKEKTRPAWRPIQRGVEWLRELVPPAFVRNLGEEMRELSANLSEVEQQMGADGEEGPASSLSENRQALADALPSVEAVLARVREILVTSGIWVAEKVGGLKEKVEEFFTELRNFRLTEHLANALSWLERGMVRLNEWAEQGVERLFERLVEGFDYLAPFVERVLGVVRRLIDVATDLMELPQLVLSSVWNLVPECIRNPIKDFVVNQILARIPVFGQLVALPDIWEKVQATAMSILRKLFVDGDLGAAAWEFFKAVMNLIGLPPELVTAVLANAAGAIGNILSDPIGFLLNSLRAAGRGFAQFFDNVGTHLWNGISSWLFGNMRQAGIEPPQDFSLRSLLGVVFQILGVTTDRVFERIGDHVGSSVAARMRRMLDHATGAWQFVQTLVQEGPGALWQALQEKLSDLGNHLLDSVIGWVSGVIIRQASFRLAPLLAPTGVSNVIAAFMELYRAVRALMAQLHELLSVVNSFLQGLNNIAAGSLEEAADFMENALGQAVPAALGLFAHYAGLGDVSTRIREMVTGIQEKVNEALDWLIDRAIRLGQGFIDLARRGGQAIRRGARALVSWWQTEREIETESGEEHTLYIGETNDGQQLIIESRPTAYEQFIRELDVPDSAEDTQREALAAARALDGHIAASNDLEHRLEQSGVEEADYTDERDRLTRSIDASMDRLSTLTTALLEASGGAESANLPSSTPRYGPQTAQGFGTSVRVDVLTNNHPAGSTPRNAPPNDTWDDLLKRRHGGSSYYVRGHLLNEHLGGPGDTWDNLTPLTQAANNRSTESMLRLFEAPVKDAVHPDNEEDSIAVNYIVTAHYNNGNHPLENEIEQRLSDAGTREEVSDERRADLETIREIIHAEKTIPDTLTCQSDVVGEVEAPSAFPLKEEIDNSFSASSVDGDYQIDHEPVKKRDLIYVNDTISEKSADDAITELQKFEAIDKPMAETIVKKFPDAGYRTYNKLRELTRITDAQWERIDQDDQYNIRLYSRNSNSE